MFKLMSKILRKKNREKFNKGWKKKNNKERKSKIKIGLRKIFFN